MTKTKIPKSRDKQEVMMCNTFPTRIEMANRVIVIKTFIRV